MAKPKKSDGHRTDIDAVRRAGGNIDTSNRFWKPKLGRNRIRVLPAWDARGLFFFESVLHYGFVHEGDKRAFPCLRKAANGFCPTCQLIGKHANDSDPDVEKIIRALAPKSRYLMNILDRGANQPTVQIFTAPFSVAKELIAVFNDEDFGDITDPEEGHDVTVEKDGAGLGTRYTVRVSPKVTAINLEDWEANLFNLEREAYREIPTPKKMAAILRDNFQDALDMSGITGKPPKGEEPIEDEDDDEEGEAPTKSGKGSGPKKPRKPSAAATDEDEDEDETEVEEEETPARTKVKGTPKKGKKRKAVAVVEEEEDDEDEFEDDDEEGDEDDDD